MEDQRLASRRDSIRVVDVDVHVDDPPQALAPYATMPWRKSLEMLGAGPQRYLDVPGYSPNVSPYAPIPGGHPKRSVRTAREMREGLDAIGVHDALLMPDHLLLFATLPNVEWATEISHAYNRWLAAEWLGREPGLHGAILACPQNPEDSIKEIQRHADTPGMVAVYLPTAGVNPLWGHARYNKLLAAIEETGLPAVLHSVSLIAPVFPAQLEQFENTFAKQIIGHTFAMMANLVSLMHTGIPARFPNLKFVFTEAGISWVPGMMWRLDRYYNEYRRVVPFLEDMPSEYMKRQMWFATQPVEEPEIPAHMTETIMHYDGMDRTVFASDWPHHDFDHPDALLKWPLTPEQRRKIMGQNAVDLFKLPAFVRESA